MDVLLNQNRDKGIVTWELGPMFAGKTTALFNHYRRSIHGKQTSVLFKNSSDNRYSSENASSHDGIQIKAISISNSSELYDEFKRLSLEKKIQNVFVDEAHFLDSGLIKVTKELVNAGTNVYIAALNQTSYGEPFPFSDGKGTVADLVQLVDIYETFTAVCYKCPFPATKTQKLHETGQIVDVGGKEMYAPACVDHWKPIK
jgi:thymidine kinase